MLYTVRGPIRSDEGQAKVVNNKMEFSSLEFILQVSIV